MFQQCIIDAQRKIQSSIELLKSGAQLVKYNYSNYKRTRRLFWISENGDELRWGKSKAAADYSKVSLADAIGIIYGPVTTTFVRCDKTTEQNIDPSYCCFSLLFMGRTLDLACYGDMINIWFLGLQYLISRYGSGGSSMPILSDSQFTVKKLQYKIGERAHLESLIYNRYLVRRVREMGEVYRKNRNDFWNLSIGNYVYKPGSRGLGGSQGPTSPFPGRPSQNIKPPRPSLPNGPGSNNVMSNTMSINNNNNSTTVLLDDQSKQRILDLEDKVRKMEMISAAGLQNSQNA